jgi:hypothetical protein
VKKLAIQWWNSGVLPSEFVVKDLSRDFADGKLFYEFLKKLDGKYANEFNEIDMVMKGEEKRKKGERW